MERAEPPLFLVDGYNMIGAWSDLRRTCQRLGFDAARDRLIEQMINFSAYKEYGTIVVFDAHTQPQPGRCETITAHLSLYFTEPNETADTYIERRCNEYHRDLLRHRKRLIVATSDRVQQLTAKGFGAECWSAPMLESAVRQVSQAVRQHASRPKTAPTIGERLKPSVRQQMNQLRFL
ncbi:MAG: NYN domain-containing protein [Oscillatoriales cyanobacterium SM2_2_1]|nr:NYN domain-containing protein [Oscillatoriales cyanobacterium SM2_2_1]